MAPIIVFITGANRGLGQGLVKGFVAKPGHVNAYLLLFQVQFKAVTDTKSPIDCYSCCPRSSALDLPGTCRAFHRRG